MHRDAKNFDTFEDLDAYKVAREFRKVMYEVSRRLPDLEKFGLASQIRRAAVSLTNNIAEGHGRFHYLDQIKFMLQSRGSAQELIDDLNVTDDEKYLPSHEVSQLKDKGWHSIRVLNGYLRWLRQRKTDQTFPCAKSHRSTATPTTTSKPGSPHSPCNHATL